MKYIIDRIEEKYAVCEDEEGKIINIELTKLPKEIKEGIVIIENSSRYYIDLNETKKLEDEIFELTKDMWE